MKKEILVLRKYVWLLLAGIVIICSGCKKGYDDAPYSTPGDTLRVLAIGNSFSWDALESELYPICHEAGVNIIIGNLYYGGCSLRQHAEFLCADTPVYSFRTIIDGQRTVYDNVTLYRALDDRQWDYISFQQASHDSGDTTTIEPWLSLLIDTVRAHQPQARLLWHMTWAYSRDAKHPAYPRYACNQDTMYQAIEECLAYILRHHDFAAVVPAGRAIQLGRQTALGDTFCRDGYHLNHLYGRYTAALTWFEILTGLDCRQIRYRASDDKGTKMSRKQRRLCQEAASEAARTSSSILQKRW